MRINIKTRNDVDKAYRAGFRRGVKSCLEDVLSTVAIALQDKHGWSPTEIKALETEVNDMFDSVIRGYVDFQDIVDAKEAEIGKAIGGKDCVAKVID